MAVPMWTVIVKNNGGSAVFFEDIGISIPASASITFSDQFTYEEIADSDDLRSAVASAGNIVINDGSNDLSATDGVWYLTFEHIEDVRANHYTKTQLQTPGQSTVDWDNIANAPDFVNLHWLPPVYARVLGLYSTPPTANEGDFYVDTDDNYIYKYVSGMWTPVVTAGLVDLRVINLSAAGEPVYQNVGGVWTFSLTPTANDAVMVQDDGDGKQAIYVYTPTDIWVKIGDVDWAGYEARITSLETSAANYWNPHLNGGPNKHDASEIDVEGTYPYLGAPDDAETVFSNIEDHIANLATVSGAAGGLDDAYDYPTPGGGRTVYVDSGSVQLSAADGGYAPLELSDLGTAPLSGLGAGQLAVINGLLYAYDSTRSKWLSIERSHGVAFGRRGNTKDQFLNHWGGLTVSNIAGQRMSRNATIVGIWGQLDSSGTCTIYVRKNGDLVTNIATLAIAAAQGAHDNTINVDLNAGDYLHCYVAATAAVSDPQVGLIIAWRA